MFYHDPGIGAYQWDALGYFDITETTAGAAGEDSLIVVDLKPTVMSAAYNDQGYTSSLDPLLASDGSQLLCSVQFDVVRDGVFEIAEAGLAWDRLVPGEGHFDSSVSRKIPDNENGEVITGNAVFNIVDDPEPGDPTPTPTIVDPGSTPTIVDPVSTPTPKPTLKPDEPVLPWPIDITIDKGALARRRLVIRAKAHYPVQQAFNGWLVAEAPSGKYIFFSRKGQAVNCKPRAYVAGIRQLRGGWSGTVVNLPIPGKIEAGTWQIHCGLFSLDGPVRKYTTIGTLETEQLDL
jgi:hypothetical protein